VTKRRRYGVLAITAGLAVLGARESAVLPPLADRLPSIAGRPGVVSARSVQVSRARKVDAVAPLSDLSPLSYQQFPPILYPGATGSIRVVLDVVGDVPEVVFRRNVPTTATGHVEELWSRLTTRNVAGRLVSVFDQAYPGTILSDLLVYSHGHDLPQVPLGRLDDPGGSGETATMWLRIASTGLPVSTVRRITPPEGGTATAQYASHAVNLVLPGFDDARIESAGDGYALEAAAQAFYRDFADRYQSLAFVPHRMPLAPFDTFHRTVWNDLEGIGMPLADDRSAFGGTTLRAVHVLPAGFLGHQATLLHQLAHHWGDRMNLGTIAGIVPAGDDPDRHTPLLYPGATLVGGVLDGTRQVDRVVTGDGVERFEIARPTAPVRFHPLQLYRMGFLDPAEVPDVTVFADQAQFEPQRVSAPAVGTAVTGARQTVSINTILAALGTRDGPVFTEWNQAVVIVSDTLLSQEEMDYYNFYAQRAAASTGTRAYDGFGSFFEATGGRASLQTAMLTRDADAHPVVTEAPDVGDVAFGTGDWRGLLFDEPIPGRLPTSTTLTLSGNIDPEVLPGSYQFLIIRASRFGDPPGDAITVQTSVRGGRFVISLRFPADGAGAYAIDAFVFVDGEATPISTSVITPLFVD